MNQFLDQFARIPSQQKALGLVGAVLLIVVGTYFFSVSDATTTIEENEATIDKQEADLLKLETQAQYRSQYMREVERLKQKLREAEEQLPKKAEVPKLLRDISYEANQSGLLVDRFELKPEKKEGEFARVPVNMRVTGSYHEIAVFLDRLAKMPRIVNVTDLSMKQPKLKNKKIVLVSQFDATTYRFLEAAKKPAKKKAKK